MNWPRALILEGEHPDDVLWADAFAASAARMGLKIAARRTFTLDRNPARRQENNIRLLTGDARYDVVFVADTRGEFGRYIPYATQDPRPVIGSVGLRPTAWHWALERDGATQVSSRFDRTYGRKMTAADWNVWIGVKALILGAAKSGVTEATSLRSYLVSDRFRLDGSKGAPLNFRDWSGQLRMPLALATAEAVIAVAPLDGFEHQVNTLDTLGSDQPEFRCQ
jgi:ABC transporter substrate binding protein (PQQ-dependent alcohol dehydrogenase system)